MTTKRSDRRLCSLLLVALCSGPPSTALAFSGLKVGAPMPNPTLPMLDGPARPLVSRGPKASVVVFMRPDQEYSKSTLGLLPPVLGRLNLRQVPLTLVVSSTYTPDQVRAFLAGGKVSLPVAIDTKDALAGKLGVVVEPAAGILDAEGKLAGYVAFKRVNFWRLVEGEVLYVLKEIDDQARAKLRDPDPPKEKSPKGVAHRYQVLAEGLAKRGNDEKALEAAKKSVSLDETLAVSHGLIAAILAKRGDCAGALVAAERALSLDPLEARALQVRKRCPAVP